MKKIIKSSILYYEEKEFDCIDISDEKVRSSFDDILSVYFDEISQKKTYIKQKSLIPFEKKAMIDLSLFKEHVFMKKFIIFRFVNWEILEFEENTQFEII